MAHFLRASFYLIDPVFSEEVIERLESILRKALGESFERLGIAEDEDDADPYLVARSGSLAAAVPEKTTIRNGLGSAQLRLPEQGPDFHLVSSKLTLPFESNRCTVELDPTVPVCGRSACEWLADWFFDAAEQLPARYGCAYSGDERDTKNLINDETGVRAIGIDYDEALPGLYWLNFFGPPYVDLIGHETLVAAPADDVIDGARGVVLQLAQRPESWDSETYGETEVAVLAHLGARYFFSRSDPDRKTVAPDFWS